MITRERAVAAVESAINRVAEQTGADRRIKLDPEQAHSHRAGRAHAYDCVSWEAFGQWHHDNGCTTAACVGVWQTMTACARHPDRITVVGNKLDGTIDVIVNSKPKSNR